MEQCRFTRSAFLRDLGQKILCKKITSQRPSVELLTREEEDVVLKRVLETQKINKQKPKDFREEYKEIVCGKLVFRHMCNCS